MSDDQNHITSEKGIKVANLEKTFKAECPVPEGNGVLL